MQIGSFIVVCMAVGYFDFNSREAEIAKNDRMPNRELSNDCGPCRNMKQPSSSHLVQTVAGHSRITSIYIPAWHNRTDVYFVMIGLRIRTTGRLYHSTARPVVGIMSPIMAKYTSVRLRRAGIWE